MFGSKDKPLFGISIHDALCLTPRPWNNIVLNLFSEIGSYLYFNHLPFSSFQILDIKEKYDELRLYSFVSETMREIDCENIDKIIDAYCAASREISIYGGKA